MTKNRLEAFSDGVLAIIITIMLIQIKIPQTSNWSELYLIIPVFISYFLSFLFIGIFWVGHHQLFHTTNKVTSGIIWANLNLLFWLSLVPFATQWLGENKFSSNTVAFYGTILLICGVASSVLQKRVEASINNKTQFIQAFKLLTKKGIISTISYILSIAIAYINPTISGILFLAVSVMWVVPNKNFEKIFNS